MTTPVIQFRKAMRHAVKVKILLKGPTGSGKTFGALHIADGLAPGKVFLLDSEHDRSDAYADLVPFEKATMMDHHPKHYMAGIDAAVAAGAEVLIIDSLSHPWLNVLARKDEYDRANPRTNPWGNWLVFGPEWDDLIRHILEAPLHVICTARSKMAHEQVEQGGRKQVVKVGLAPQIRDNTEYDFLLAFDLETTTDQRHPAQVSKDNTRLFNEVGKVWDLTDGTVPALIRQWLSTAKERIRPSSDTLKAIDDALLSLPEDKQGRARKKIAMLKQGDWPEDDARTVLESLQQMIRGETPTRAAATPAATPAPTTASATPASPAPQPTTPESVEPSATETRASDSPAPSAAPTVSEPAPIPIIQLVEAEEMEVQTSSGVVRLGELPTPKLAKLETAAKKRPDLAHVAAAIGLILDHRQREEAAKRATRQREAEQAIDDGGAMHAPAVAGAA